MNQPNPLKVNNKDSVNLAAQFMFGGKRYDELKPTQQVKLFENLNSNDTFFQGKMASIADSDRKASMTRKKLGIA